MSRRAHRPDQEQPPSEAPRSSPAQPQGASAEGAAADASAQEPVSKEVVERLQQELRQAQDRHLRALAEADNTRKRLQREQQEYARFATEAVIRELLPLLDSLDQALVAADQQAEAASMIKGIELIRRQLARLLDNEGVRRIPTVGQPFDPHQHEAVDHVETDDGRAEGTIVEELHAGYTMHGKVVRPAMVKVAKRAARDQQPGDSTSAEPPGKDA